MINVLLATLVSTLAQDVLCVAAIYEDLWIPSVTLKQDNAAVSQE